LAKDQTDREFFTFKSAVYGIRALARLLITYQDKYGLCTIEGIITRWAPAIENNTQGSYIQAVARNTGFSALQTLDMHRFEHLKPVVEAIIQHENGQQPYSDAEITKALVLAGVEPKQQNLQASRTVKGGQVATAGTLGAGAIEAVQETLEPATQCIAGHCPISGSGKMAVAGCHPDWYWRHAVGAYRRPSERPALMLAISLKAGFPAICCASSDGAWQGFRF
jgi:hypothetical protein